MRLVDKCDSQISSVACQRKSFKWYIKLFYHLLDVSMFNAYTLWLVSHDSTPTKKVILRDFVYDVWMQLLEDYGRPHDRTKGRRPTNIPDRLCGCLHFPVHTEMTASGKRKSLQCYVCRHTKRRPQKRTRVNIKCEECNVALCADKCFQEYNTLKNF